jgi:hypothetical protein
LIKISMIGAGKGHKVKAVERWQQELSWEVWLEVLSVQMRWNWNRGSVNTRGS